MKMRRVLFGSILSKPMSWFDHKQNAPGQLATVLQTDCTTVNGVFGDIIAQWMESLFSLCLGISLGLYFNWKITLVALAIAPFLGAATYVTIAIEEKRSELIDKEAKEANVLAGDAIVNYRTVASFGTAERLVQEYDRLLEGPMKITI